MRLIDRSKLEMDVKKWLEAPCPPDDSVMVALDDIAVSVLMTIEEQPLVKAVPIDKLRNLVNKLQDEKDYAYANFDEYKLDVLGCDDVDDLPNDDYRFGLNRAIKLLQLLIAESEE